SRRRRQSVHGLRRPARRRPLRHREPARARAGVQRRRLQGERRSGGAQDAARGARLPGELRAAARRVRRRRGRALPALRPLGTVRVRPPGDRPRADPRLRTGLSPVIRFEGFAGRAAVVTGAGGGMGLQIARDLLEAGAKVTGIDVKERPGELKGATYAQGDVSDARFVAGAIRAAFAESGRLDYLVNAAGVLWFGRDRSLLDIDLDVWNRLMAINLTGCMLTARHAIPLMQRTGGGAMVHFSSTQCLRGDDKPQDAYQAAKAGILALSKSIAIQFAKDKIRSNVILPSATESPMQAR